MTGGGGGIIIIRPMLESGRCTEKEVIELREIIERQDGPCFSSRDAKTVGRIAEAICKRP